MADPTKAWEISRRKSASPTWARDCFRCRASTYASGIGSANVGTQQLFANSTFHYADNVTIIRGRHMIKTGGQLMRRRLDAFYSGNNGRTGFLNFNGQYTQGPNGKSPTSKAFSEADFVLGLPNDIGRGLSNGNTWGQRQNVWGLYVQDDWRVNNSLTLNLGVRWEYSTPWVEVKDRQVNFGLFTGQEEFAGQNGNSRGLYAPYKKDFQPRVGFAWTPAEAKQKLVVRGAYTISSFMEGTGTNLRLTMNPPINSEFEAVYQSALSNLPGTTVDQGFVGSRGAFVGANIRLWDPNVRPAEVQQWNLTLEYQLPANNVLSVGYIGQHGTHLIAAMPFFQKQLVTPGQTPLPSPYLAGNPDLVSQITQISGTQSGANQMYNALQAGIGTQTQVEARDSNIRISYTWAHGMSDSIGYYGDSGQSGSQSAYMQNLYDRRSEWGPQLADVKHNFVASYYYELPLGKGKKFGSTMAKPLDYAIGGWQMGGTFTAHTGFPLTIKTTDRSGTLARSARAEVIGTPNDSHIVGPGNHWLDVSAYAQPANLTFGDAGPGVVRGPGATIFNLSPSKRFPVAGAQILRTGRGEAFNLANTPIFNSPISQTITSSTFGEISTTSGERNMQIVAKFYFLAVCSSGDHADSSAGVCQQAHVKARRDSRTAHREACALRLRESLSLPKSRADLRGQLIDADLPSLLWRYAGRAPRYQSREHYRQTRTAGRWTLVKVAGASMTGTTQETGVRKRTRDCAAQLSVWDGQQYWPRSSALLWRRMCLAIPGKIVEFHENQGVRMSKVDFGGITREACLEYVPDAKLGDYVLVQCRLRHYKG